MRFRSSARKYPLKKRFWNRPWWPLPGQRPVGGDLDGIHTASTSFPNRPYRTSPARCDVFDFLQVMYGRIMAEGKAYYKDYDVEIPETLSALWIWR